MTFPQLITLSEQKSDALEGIRYPRHTVRRKSGMKRGNRRMTPDDYVLIKVAWAARIAGADYFEIAQLFGKSPERAHEIASIRVRGCVPERAGTVQ